MALQTIAPWVWPGIFNPGGTIAPSIGALTTVDAAGEYLATVICAPHAMVISHVGFRIGPATGSPTLDVRIETVDTAGLPSGTLWATNTNIVTGALSAAFTLQALTAAATIAKGQLFCVKLAYNGGTSAGIQEMANYYGCSALPYNVVNTGSPAKAALRTISPVLALGSSATAFYSIPGIVPFSVFTANTFNNTNSAARGLRFQVPFKCRVIGIRFYNGASTGGFAAVMYDDAGAELSSSSTAFDGDQMANTHNNVDVYFDNAVTLDPATWYRAALVPDSTTNITIATFTLASLNYVSATAFGANAHYATRASGTWTDTATDQIPLMNVIIDQLGNDAGAADYPSEDDVRDGVTFDTGGQTGNLVLPTAAQVKTGIGFGTSGTELTGTVTLPVANDVRDGVDYGAGGTEFDGDLVLPTAAQVETGVGFGADGTEFTGTLSAGGGRPEFRGSNL